MAMSIRLLVLIAAFMMATGPCRADDGIDWRHRVSNGSVTLSANPLSPAQRTAFYLARGFSESSIQPYAQACGFSFSLQNIGAATLRTRLVDWRAVGAEGRAVRLRLPGEWDMRWTKAQVTEAARIAFRWAQFQADNVFEAGDWIMGMATLETPLPGTFRLVARYHDEKGDHEIVLDQLACAQD